MRPAVWFRVAAVLIALFAVGHTFGFRQVDPGWGIDAVLTAMRSVRFPVQGFVRTYWDFYVGFGLFCSVFLLFAASVAWQLGSLPATVARGLGSALAASFGAVIVLSWRYFFVAPLVFSTVIFLCLLAGVLTSRVSSGG